MSFNSLGALAGAALGFAAVEVGDIEQARDAADQGILVAAHRAVGIGDVPQHFDDADPFPLGKIIHDDSGEMVQIGSARRALPRRRDEARGLERLQAEAPRQDALDDAPLAVGEAVVAARGFEQQHGERKGRIVAFVRIGGGRGVVGPRQDPQQGIEHVVPFMPVAVSHRPICAAGEAAAMPRAAESGSGEGGEDFLDGLQLVAGGRGRHQDRGRDPASRHAATPSRTAPAGPNRVASASQRSLISDGMSFCAALGDRGLDRASSPRRSRLPSNNCGSSAASCSGSACGG